MGPLGVLSLPTHGLYMGTWSATGVQEGDGVEAYADGGFYRGQYKHGQRSGFGTRSSSGHEQRKDVLIDPRNKSKHIKIHQRPSVASIMTGNQMTLPHHHEMKRGEENLMRGSSSGSADNIHSGLDWDQVYEGEWANDKRCGHGILKVSDYFTYYGQWKENTRTGYGVLVYEGHTDKKGWRKQEIKEEGRWEDGKLVEAVKHSRLKVMKKTDLQEKVEEAHTEAINAATLARDRARVAESKANAAAAKSKVAEMRANEARKHATTASKRVERAAKISSEAVNDVYRIKGSVRIVLNDHEPQHETKRRSRTLNHDTNHDASCSYFQLASENDHTHYNKPSIHPAFSCQNFKEIQSSPNHLVASSKKLK